MMAYVLPSILKPARRVLGVVVASSLAAGLLAGGLAGQSLWTNPDGRASLHLEMFRPHFSDDEVEFTGATGAGFVTGRLSLNDAWAVVADLPFSRAAWDVASESRSSTMIGNPYVGVEWRAARRLTAELGLRAPVGDLEDVDQLAAMIVGMAGELERLEAFVPETLGLYATASYRQPVARSLSLRLRGGPAFLTGDGGPDDLLLAYTGQLWYDNGPLSVGSGLTGRANLTTDDDDADRTAHQVVVAGDYRIGQLRPGLQLRLPLDKDVRELTGYTIGVSLGYSFR